MCSWQKCLFIWLSVKWAVARGAFVWVLTDSLSSIQALSSATCKFNPVLNKKKKKSGHLSNFSILWFLARGYFW